METREKQYRELCEEYRTVLKLFWEIPSIVIAIVSGILIGNYALKISDQYKLLGVFLNLLSSFMVFIAFLSGWKHRRFGYSYVELLKARDKIPRHTKQLKEYVENQKRQHNLDSCQRKRSNWRKPLEISVQKLFLVLLANISCVFLLLAFYEFLNWMSATPSDFSLSSLINVDYVLLMPVVLVYIVVNVWFYRYLD